MTGVALFNFLIVLVALFGAVILFFYAIEGISPDALFTKIARFAIGIAAVIVFLFAVRSVLFGGGTGISITPMGIFEFAIGIIVTLIVLKLVKLAVDYWIPQFAVIVMYVVGGIALIALMYLAEQALLGGGLTGSLREGGGLLLKK